jgi:tetratricopeptide (TPR) repeat protein
MRQPTRVLITAALVALLTAPALLSAQGGSAGQGTTQVLQKLQTAHVLYGQRDYAAARRLYLEVLPTYPNDLVILKNLAYSCYRLRRYDEAATYYQRAYERSPGSREILDYLARSLSNLKRYDEAAKLFRQLAESPDAPAVAWKLAAEAYASGGRVAEAERAYDAYLQRNPGDLDARADLGKVYVEKKDYARAAEQFRLVLSTNPNFTPALKGMALAMSRQGNLQEAMQYYERVLRLDPRDGEAQTGKAFILYWTGRLEDAKQLFTQIHRRHPDNSEVTRALDEIERKLNQEALEVARATGNVADVETHYRERLARDPNDAEALKFMAGVTANSEKCQESIDFGQRALRITPQDADVELTLARAYAFCERYQEAYAHYQRYVEVQQQAEKPLTELGQLMLRASKYEEALSIFQRVLTLNADNTEARVGLARSYAGLRQYDDALAQYDAVLAKHPDHYDALQGKALILYWTNQDARARPLLEQLAQRKPDDATNREALDSIAKAAEAAHWEEMRPGSEAPPEEFVAYYQKRLAAYPDDKAAMKGLAYNESRLRNYQEAEAWYRKALEIDPEDRSAKMDLARILSLDRQYDASTQLYRELLQATPGDIYLRERLAIVYTWAGQYESSLAAYQSLQASQPSNTDYRLQVIRLQMRLGKTEEARRNIDALLKMDPQNRDAQLYLAQLSMDENQRQVALSHYDAVLARDPDDTSALYGKARVLYYDDQLDQAYEVASHLLKVKPDSFDGTFLLANIENRRRRRKQALDLLARADQLSPDNSEVRALTQRIREAPVLTLHTAASYGREYDAFEDLRTQSYSATFGWEIGRTDAFLALGYSPSSSPTPGIRGAIGPTDFLYWQRTRLGRAWEVRAGVGAVHFTDGEDDAFPGQPAAEFDAQGLVGVSYMPVREFRLDLDYRRSPIDYTPRAARLGVMRDRVGIGLNFFPDTRTRITADYDYNAFNGLGPGSLQAHTVDLLAMRNLYRDDRLAFDLGYSAQFMDFAQGGPFLGFFAPDFYQIHQAVADFHATLAPPLDFDISGAFGIRQEYKYDTFDRLVKPLRRGGSVRPSFTIRVNRHLTVSLRYTYYNTAQLLGLAPAGAREQLVGNVFSVTTDWKF